MSHPPSEIPEFSAIASLFADETRRRVLFRLRTVGRTTAPDLGRYLAAVDRGVDPGEVDEIDGPRPATIALYHDHLPRLDEHGVVDYDRTAGEITPGPNFDEVEPIVASLERAAEQ